NKQKQQQEKLETLTPYYNKLDRKRTEKEDFQLILKIKSLSEELMTCQQNSRKGKTLVQNKKEGLSNNQKQITLQDEEIGKLKAKRIDARQLREVGSWYQETENQRKQIQQQQAKIATKKEALDTCLDKLKAKNIQPETFEEEASATQQKIERQKKILGEKKEQLAVQEKLSEHAHQLKEGEACPLCGALEHPDIIETQNISVEIAEISASMKELVSEEKTLQNKKDFFLDQRATINNLKKDRHSEEEYLKSLEHSLAEHQAQFKWDD